MRVSLFLPLAAVVAHASASIVNPKAVLTSNEILRRQSADCGQEAACQRYNSVSASCSDVTCLCTEANAADFQACQQCVLEADPSTASEVQDELSSFANLCNSGGSPVGALTVTDGAAASTSAPASVTPSAVVLTTPVIVSSPAATASAAHSGAGQVKIMGAGVLASALAVVVALV